MADFVGPPLSEETGLGARTLGGFLREVCARTPTAEALCFHEPGGRVVRWTYADLWAETERTARSLLGLGVGRGTRVALLMGNRPEWVAACFGATAIGALLVPVNTFFTAGELSYVLEHSAARLLLTQRELAGHSYLADLAPLRSRLPDLAGVFALGEPSWAELTDAAAGASAADVAAAVEQVRPDDDALVIYTSGTTGRPKGVLHAHRAPTIQSWRFRTQLRLTPDVRSWSAFPYFWTAGFCMVMGATLAAGGCLVQQERFEPGEALALLAAERVTTPYAWPHQLAALEEHPAWGDTDLSSLRHVESYTPFARHPSVPAPAGDVYSPRSAYGTTETFTIVSSLPADTPVELRENNHGALLPGTTVRIVDVATDSPLGVGAMGEIRVKGPTLMKGYLGVPAAECFDADGFYATGDAGFVDERGLLHWVGRTSGLIKTGGANVSPVEVEEVLLRHPDLALGVVVGVPHPTLGEMVVLLAARHRGRATSEADLQHWLRGRIASYKIPRRVVWVAEDELKQTGNAKPEPAAARTLAMSRLGIS